MSCGDIKETKFVRTRGVIGNCGLDRIAGIAQVNEVDALDDTAVLDVETGNDTDLEHRCCSYAAARALRISVNASAGSMRPS